MAANTDAFADAVVRIGQVGPATNYDGVIGNVQFDAHGDLKHGVISMYGYKSGKRALIGVEQM